MNVSQYLEQRAQFEKSCPQRRPLCFTCLQPKVTCYCAHVQTFNPNIDFVILIHPLEMRRRVATGRMSHLCLQNSLLIQGHNYSRNAMVNEILQDPQRECVILYPGVGSTNLTPLKTSERVALFRPEKKLTVFVIDGTWLTAKQMVKLSTNLHGLPRICFNPPRLSEFRVRKQPHEQCFSTIEAIHHTIELLGESRGFATETREHDRLLKVFEKMVLMQLSFIEKSKSEGRPNRYRVGRKAKPRPIIK